jgi:hypothetical protein
VVSIGRLPDKERRKVRRDYKKDREVRGERKFRKEPFFKRNRIDWNDDE